MEAGDAITITDRNGEEHKSYLTSLTLNPGTFEQLECSAKSVSRNKQKQYTLNQQAQSEYRKSLRDERTSREKRWKNYHNALRNLLEHTRQWKHSRTEAISIIFTTNHSYPILTLYGK